MVGQKKKITSMNKNIIIFIFIVSLVSCSITETKNNSYQKAYKKIKGSFESDMLSHFPEKVSGAYSFKSVFPTVAKTNGRCGVLLICKYDSIKNIISLIHKSIQFSTLGDSCNLIVNYDNNITSLNSHLNRSSNCINDSIPIPDIEKLILQDSFVKEKLLTNVGVDFLVYVIEAKKGEFLTGESLTSGKGLPKEWKNGYSKGIAINKKDKVIIYWLEMW